MLVLSRKIGETIVIGDDIKITIIDMKGGKVRIGIQAPPNVTINRQEIHDAIQNKNDTTR